MKKIILSIFAIVLIESTFISVPLTLTFLTALSLVLGTEVSLTVFLSGLLLDILTMRTLGTDSFVFLLICYLVSRYKLKMYLGHGFAPVILFLVIIPVYSYVFYKSVAVFPLIAMVIVGRLLQLIFQKMFPQRYGNQMRLEV